MHQQFVSHNIVKGLTQELWSQFKQQGLGDTKVQNKIYRLIYSGGVEHQLRKEVWLYLLGHLEWDYSIQQIADKNSATQTEYESSLSEWGALEAIVQQQDKELYAANMARLEAQRSESLTSRIIPEVNRMNSMPNDVFESIDSAPEYLESPTPDRPSTITEVTEQSMDSHSSSNAHGKSRSTSSSSARICQENRLEDRNKFSKAASDEGIEDINVEDLSEAQNDHDIRPDDMDEPEPKIAEFGVKITTPSVDSGNPDASPPDDQTLTIRRASDQLAYSEIQQITRQIHSLSSDFRDDLLAVSHPTSVCPSPASSEGGTYSMEMVENFGLNLHRIDKDVARCDRNLEFFSKRENLEKLRNVITTYVWENLEIGYMQGMCDLAAPLLTIFPDEWIVYFTFKLLMNRMIKNFPNGDQMDSNFANMRALMQVLDPGLFDKVQQNGDFSHFYFCYRWFLLDFKREFDYEGVYRVWETIWCASRVSTEHFYLFFALGLVETYRDIILDRNMDFTDIIKFFNEMSERHDLSTVLLEANTLINNLQLLCNDNE